MGTGAPGSGCAGSRPRVAHHLQPELRPAWATLPRLLSAVRPPRGDCPAAKQALHMQAAFPSSSFRPPPDGPGQAHTPRSLLGSEAPRELANGAFIIVSHLARV